MVERLGALPERMAKDRRVTVSHYRVAHVIACRANRLGGWGWVVMATIAEKTDIGVQRDAGGQILSLDVRDVRRLVNDLVGWGYFERRDAESRTAPPNAREFRVLYDQGEGSMDPGVPHPTDPGASAPRGPTSPGSHNPGSLAERGAQPRGPASPGSGIPGGRDPLQVVPALSLSSFTSRGRAIETRVRQLIPAEFHSALESYLGKTKAPDELVVELWDKALNPEKLPHFAGAIVGQALREMSIADRPFRSGSLVKWCANLAADAAAPPTVGRRREGGGGVSRGLERIAKGGDA